MMKFGFWTIGWVLGLGLLLLAGCRPAPGVAWQGYFEGDYIYVAAPLAGRLETLAVEKGTRVTAGAPLFSLEKGSELATQHETGGRWLQAQARWEDLKKGLRPTELAALEARLGQARSTRELAALQWTRITQLKRDGATTVEDLDRARLTLEGNEKLILELEAQLATARLGGRAGVIAAAEAEVVAARAAVERADWNVNQKTQTAPADALVFETLYRVGEFVGAGAPIVALLPPGQIKIRFFVPEADFAGLKVGDRVRVVFTGHPEPLAARINYLAPQPEYTPPVLYNRENRSKLVFLVEAAPVDAAAARDLHPGQPVDVTR